ncbi:MAG: hypothetical protein A3E84_05180 [Gammaproteobacteria bacterium RIFCSPHIGHO2_12_FULL_42_13]|nr:MAG: hypothetical protein A3E84_05180 [Gammaproteobacteria bacterium RIFCSPHIGHO2_12_FULL_42_13]
MNNCTTLYFKRGKLKFSAGHFTIFSATHRESLHGHNYSLEIKMVAQFGAPGIVKDYREIEQTIISLCQRLNWRFLLPTQSPYLRIQQDDEHYEITFNGKSMWLLQSDVVLLPLENITLETLSQWFTCELKDNTEFMKAHLIESLSVTVFNGPYHAAESCC